ncbi:MAG: glycosyltransferase family 1 protein [Proteobacteria bacterium]|nr:glycosyltransferase family 1 protein [Pseudomonadota bacterium]
MNILMIAVNDPAGTAIGFADALNRRTGHFCRVVTLETRYNHSWRKDLHVPNLDEDGLGELEQALRSADVFHFHMTADEDLRLGPFLPRDYMHGKALVHHHHGHPDFRDNPGKYSHKYRELNRHNLLVSTPDLLHILPEAHWQPNCVNEQDPAYQPLTNKPQAPLRIAHSPTRWDLKNTDDLLGVMRALSADGHALELDLIDDAPHGDCLERKRRSHIAFDHMQGYYGMSSLESLAQGVPTVAGLSGWCMDRMREFTGSIELPWLVARDAEELKETLTHLAYDTDARHEAGARSRDFMERHWSEERVIGRLMGFYETL